MRLGGFIQAGIWVDPSIVLEETTTREGVSAIAGKWGGLPQFSYVAKDNSADQLRISAGDYVLCVPYERARGGQLHDKDIVVIERVRRGGAFERTIKQIILTEFEMRARLAKFRTPLSIDRDKRKDHDGKRRNDRPHCRTGHRRLDPLADGHTRSTSVDRLRGLHRRTLPVCPSL